VRHHKRLTRALLVLIGTLGPLGLLAAAAQATPPRGGSGGSAFNLDCGSDAVLAGVTIRAGTLVDSVEVICVKVRADGSWSGSYASKGKAGGSGGGLLSLSGRATTHAHPHPSGSAGRACHADTCGGLVLGTRDFFLMTNAPASVVMV